MFIALVLSNNEEAEIPGYVDYSVYEAYGLSFDTPQPGIRAQMQHLKAYAERIWSIAE